MRSVESKLIWCYTEVGLGLAYRAQLDRKNWELPYMEKKQIGRNRVPYKLAIEG
jgi:hypothetical protein